MICFGVKSALPSRQHIPRAANSCIFCTYRFPLSQTLQNQQLPHSLGSVHSKGTLTPLNSTLTDMFTLTPAESTLTEKGGRGPKVLVPPPITRPAPGIERQCYYPGSVLSRTDN